ncbi:MAG TPA: CoA-binding protein [Pseudomonadales bacterium]|nr:CoA-binding protein [Pseudomonadales bacterium]
MGITAVLGASPKADRYSNKAIRMLREYGHEVIPVHPVIAEIDGLKVSASLKEIVQPVDTLTLYVGPDRSEALSGEIVALHPRRVIMNPGAENEALKQRLEQAGIEVVEACTLVMLRTGQY